ncbi:trypsin-like serine peptidase [Myxococcota bacterium]
MISIFRAGGAHGSDRQRRTGEEQIERLKREISLERLAEAKGVKLKKHGPDLMGLCPAATSSKAEVPTASTPKPALHDGSTPTTSAEEAATATEEEELQEAIQGTDERELVNAYTPTRYSEDLNLPKVEFVQRRKVPVGALAEPNDGAPADVPPSALNPSQVKRYCSGTPVGPDLFLTAGHCCDFCGADGDDRIAGESSPRVCDCSAKAKNRLVGSSFVSFGYELDPGYERADYTADESIAEAIGDDRYRIEEVVEQAYRVYPDAWMETDYMLLKLEGQPGAKYGWVSLAESVPAAGTTVTIVGHPGGQPKQVSVGRIMPLERASMGYPDSPAGNRIVSLLVDGLAGRLCWHDADTVPRSSGSGVLDPVSGKLIRVHVGGETNVANRAMDIEYLLEISANLADAQEHAPWSASSDWCRGGRVLVRDFDGKCGEDADLGAGGTSARAATQAEAATFDEFVLQHR